MKIKRTTTLVAVGVAFFAAFGWPSLTPAFLDDWAGESGDEVGNTVRGDAEGGPMIIWFHSGVANSVESLEVALSSEMVTHVLLLHMHRADADWKTHSEVQRAIAVVKASPAELIWCRDLWPYYANEGIDFDLLFDPAYYTQEIEALRAEAKEIGARLVALDLEPYGNSPMKQYLSTNAHPFDTKRLQDLRDAVDEAVRRVGKVDYTLPAGWFRDVHPYQVLASLGEARITEKTYYANENVIRRITHPYEVFGVHLNTTRLRPANPDSPYFRVSDVFDRSDLWSDKNQLFFYSTREDCLAVAKDLVTYAKTRSARSSGGKEAGDPP